MIKRLLNHAKDKADVTSRYVRPSTGHVADAAQRVADFLEGRLVAATALSTGADVRRIPERKVPNVQSGEADLGLV